MGYMKLGSKHYARVRKRAVGKKRRTLRSSAQKELIDDYLRRLKTLKTRGILNDLGEVVAPKNSKQTRKEIEKLKIELDYAQGKISLDEYYRRLDAWRERWKRLDTAKRVNKPFPHGDKLPKDKKFKVVPIASEKFWSKQKNLAEWGRREAKQLYRRLKSLEGQYVMLTGGGWAYPSPGYIVKLEKAEINHPVYYDANKPYKPKNRWVVIAHLRWGHLSSQLSGADHFPNGERVFSPHLGSWRIHKIEEQP